MNDAAKARLLVVEHPRVPTAELVSPREVMETTADLYRFDVELPSRTTKRFTVETRRPTEERFELVDQDVSALVYLAKRSLPTPVTEALEQAAAILGRKVEADREAAEAAKAESRLVAEQQRIRENLTAVGPATRPGANYQRRLEAMEARLEALAERHEAATRVAEQAKAEFAEFVSTLNLP